MMNYQLKMCTVDGCDQYFFDYGAMLYCDYHAAQKLALERAVAARLDKRRKAKFDNAGKWIPIPGDIMIVDENGNNVWAAELAYRYRVELAKRQHKDYSG